MEPKELGGLAVRMKSAGDRLEIAFVADKGETARMISDKSATLESQLQGAGIGLGGIDISTAAKQPANATGLPSATGGGSANGAGSDPRGNSDSTPQRQDPAGRNRQDQSHETVQKAGDQRAIGGGHGLYL